MLTCGFYVFNILKSIHLLTCRDLSKYVSMSAVGIYVAINVQMFFASLNFLHHFGPHNSTPLMVFSVTYYLELHKAISISYRSHFLNQQRLNWLYGHNRALTSSSGQNLHQQ